MPVAADPGAADPDREDGSSADDAAALPAPPRSAGGPWIVAAGATSPASDSPTGARATGPAMATSEAGSRRARVRAVARVGRRARERRMPRKMRSRGERGETARRARTWSD